MLGRGALLSTFLRSFVVQGSWNYHTMLGSGFAFALLPGLRRVYAGDREGYEAAVRRHLEHFNAHPYLVGLALGATLRMEEDGVGAETVHRFKVAVRGPLGSLGDQLVWATWLPLVECGPASRPAAMWLVGSGGRRSADARRGCARSGRCSSAFCAARSVAEQVVWPRWGSGGSSPRGLPSWQASWGGTGYGDRLP